MELNLEDLIITEVNISITDFSIHWKWLIEDIKQILFISKMGDVFVEGVDNKVYWVATDNGILNNVAESVIKFQTLLKDPNNLDNWFLPDLLNQLKAAKIILNENQVYGYKKLPVIGGEYTIDNIIPINIKTHLELTGVLLKQINDLPDGASIKIRLTD